MAGGKNSQHQIKINERRILALELRKSGASYRDIAAAVRQELGIETGYSASNAFRDVQVEMSHVRDKLAEKAEVLLQIELERLNDLLRAIWDRATGGDTRYVEQALHIMDRIDALTRLTESAPFGVQGGAGSMVSRIVFEMTPADVPSSLPEASASGASGMNDEQ